MATMNALRSHRRGGPETLEYEQAPVPEPDADEVRVAVRAAGITFDELLWDLSWTRDGKDRTPVIPSHEFFGVVDSVGRSVTDLAPGQQVIGMAPFDRDGAAAEYVVVPSSFVSVAPENVSPVQAAAMPLAALTAWQALVDHARVTQGERVLVLGGTGGVGSFVTQIAHHIGAHVTATIRGEGAELARQLGAEDVVDVLAHADQLTDRSFDVVIDTVGGDSLDRAFPLLRRGGRLVTLPAPPSEQKAAAAGVEAMFFVVSPDRASLNNVADLASAGAIRPQIAATFDLCDGRRAYESGRDKGRRPGKTVLTVG
jgi:NADPH:quinone reductase-like Zn-dependent oxidoreductase